MAMKVLIISNLFPPHVLGGYEILCGQICDELTYRGCDVRVLTSRHGMLPGQECDGLSGVFHYLQLYQPFDRYASLMRCRRVLTSRANYDITRTVLQRLSPDVIFIWSQLRLTLGAARAAQQSGVPVVYAFNDEHIAGYVPARFHLTPKGMLRYVADRWVYPQITLKGVHLDRSTCISQLLKDNLLAGGVPCQSSRVIYQGIAIRQFPPKADPGSIAQPARVLYAGQLHPYKGVHTLIEAVNRLTRDDATPRLRLTIVGSGPSEYVDRLKHLIGAGDGDIRIIGRLPHSDLPEVYRSHDIFVFPSIWAEPFGLTHLEAMASGTPVITTTTGGHAEFIVDGENALTFDPEDVTGLAGQIVRLIGQPELAAQLATTARQLVEDKFTLSRYAADLEALLQEAAEAGE